MFEKRKIVTLVALPLSFACATPLEKAVKATLPSTYAPRLPATGQANLGHRMLKDGPDAIQCYTGTKEEEQSSWSLVEVNYESKSQALLEGDFGKVVSVTGQGKHKVSAIVKLEDTKVVSATDLFIDPTAACAQAGREQYLEGKTDKVVVRAVSAGEIAIEEESGSAATIEVNVAEVGGAGVNIGAGAGAGGSEVGRWTGTNVFFAQQVLPYHTQLTLKQQTVAVGSATDALGPCRVKVTGRDDTLWTGELNCEDGTERPLSAKLDAWAKGLYANGVSYGVLVSKGEPGAVKVELARWVTAEKE
jgi:hypothetical protein